MDNSILDLINQQRNNAPAPAQTLNPQVIQNVKNIMNQVRMAQNPMLALNQMISSNPQLSNAINLIRQSGGNPQSTFYTLARQMNVDPQAILNLLSQ